LSQSHTRKGDSQALSPPPRATGSRPPSPTAAPPSALFLRRRRRQWSPGEARATPAAAAFHSPRHGSRSGPPLSLAAVLFGGQRSGVAGGAVVRWRHSVASGGGVPGRRRPPVVAGQDLGDPGPRWARAGPDGLGRAGSLSSRSSLEVATTTLLGWDGGKAGVLQQGCRSFTGPSGPG
jgi:hypothetical protein